MLKAHNLGKCQLNNFMQKSESMPETSNLQRPQFRMKPEPLRQLNSNKQFKLSIHVWTAFNAKATVADVATEAEEAAAVAIRILTVDDEEKDKTITKDQDFLTILTNIVNDMTNVVTVQKIVCC